MKSKLTYSSDIIAFIHNSSKKFVEESYGDEILFFDEFWKIYEPQLKKWAEKQPRRWRFKMPKSKHPKFLSISGGTDALDLVTPKVIEAVSASFFQIAGLREKVSLDLVEDVIIKCGRRLSDELKAQIKNFFAPIIIRDLKMMREMPPEKEIKEEIRAEAQIASVGDKFPTKKIEEKKEYVMYSHLHPQGKELTKEEYFQERKVLKKDYLIWIDTENRDFFIKGKRQKVPPASLKALKMLIKSPNVVVEYKMLFECISSIPKSGTEYTWSKYYWDNVHGYIMVLHDKTKYKIKDYVISVAGKGYKFIDSDPDAEKKIRYSLLEPS